MKGGGGGVRRISVSGAGTTREAHATEGAEFLSSAGLNGIAIYAIISYVYNINLVCTVFALFTILQGGHFTPPHTQFEVDKLINE